MFYQLTLLTQILLTATFSQNQKYVALTKELVYSISLL